MALPLYHFFILITFFHPYFFFSRPIAFIQYLTLESTPNVIVLRTGKTRLFSMALHNLLVKFLLAFSYIKGFGFSLQFACCSRAFRLARKLVLARISPDPRSGRGPGTGWSSWSPLAFLRSLVTTIFAGYFVKTSIFLD